MIPQVQLIHEAVELATKLGYEVREDWLTGEGSGHCRVRGQKILLLDLAEPREGQVAALRDALYGEEQLTQLTISRDLAELLDIHSIV